MRQGECGMYLLGTFVVDGIPDHEDDLDFFTFPELDTSIGADALDAPIDGFCLAERRRQPGRRARRCSSTSAPPRQPTPPTRRDAAHRGQRPAPTPSSYSDLQKKSAEVVGARPRHRPVPRPRHPARLRLHGDDPRRCRRSSKNPDDIDGVTKSIQEQKVSIFGWLTVASRPEDGIASSRSSTSTARRTAAPAAPRGPPSGGGCPRATGSWSSLMVVLPPLRDRPGLAPGRARPSSCRSAPGTASATSTRSSGSAPRTTTTSSTIYPPFWPAIRHNLIWLVFLFLGPDPARHVPGGRARPEHAG